MKMFYKLRECFAQIKDMFKYVFRNVKEPQIRTIRYITEKLKSRNSSLSDRWRQLLILIIAYMLIKCLTKNNGK